MSFSGGGANRLANSRMSEGRTPVPRERGVRTARKVLAFFVPYRGRILVVLGAILVTSTLGVINPILLKLLIDVAIGHRDFALLNLFVILMVAIPIVSSVIGVGQQYLNNTIGQGVMRDLRHALYSHLQGMPLRFFTETRTGEIQSRLNNDVGGIQSVVTDTAAGITSNVAVVVSTIVAMLFIDWRLTAMSLVMLPVFAYIANRVGKTRRAASTETQKALADMTAETEETLSVSGILLSKTFGQQQASIDKFDNLSQRVATLQVRKAMVGRWFFALIGTIMSIIPAFVYWFAGYLAINHDPHPPTIGDIVAFTTLQSRLFFPLGQMLNVQVELQGALALFDRIFEYLDMEPEIADAPDAITIDPAAARGSVRFRDVWFRYPIATAAAAAGTTTSTAPADAPDETRPFALEAIDFEVKPGQLIALVGPSGAGKTTTTYLIPRLYDADEGSVEIDGVDVRGIKLASIGRVVGFVTQETYLFHSTIRDNLRYARPEATELELETAARASAIHERIMELP